MSGAPDFSRVASVFIEEEGLGEGRAVELGGIGRGGAPTMIDDLGVGDLEDVIERIVQGKEARLRAGPVEDCSVVFGQWSDPEKGGTLDAVGDGEIFARHHARDESAVKIVVRRVVLPGEILDILVAELAVVQVARIRPQPALAVAIESVDSIAFLAANFDLADDRAVASEAVIAKVGQVLAKVGDGKI